MSDTQSGGQDKRYQAKHFKELDCWYVDGPRTLSEDGICIDSVYEALEEAEHIAERMNFAFEAGMQEARALIERGRRICEDAAWRQAHGFYPPRKPPA
jgi:hypothetical protein